MFYSVFLSICLVVVGETFASPNCAELPPLPFNKIRECCKSPDVEDAFRDTMSEKCKELLKTAPAGGAPGEAPKLYPCAIDCHFNEIGLIEDGKLNSAKAKAFVEKTITEPGLRELYIKAFETCDKKVKEFMANMDGKLPGLPQAPNCNPLAGIIAFCTMFEVVKNCPENIWTNDAKCNASKEYLATCAMAGKNMKPTAAPSDRR